MSDQRVSRIAEFGTPSNLQLIDIHGDHDDPSNYYDPVDLPPADGNGLINERDEVIENSIAEREDAELLVNLSASRVVPIVTAETKREESDEPFEDLSGFFYIIQTADVPVGVYKIGKTARANPNKRLCEYPKFSSVKYTVSVEDCHGFESYAMRKFRVLFKRRREFGLEYYEGDIKDMINLAHKLWNQFGSAGRVIVDTAIEKIKPNGFQAFVNEWYSQQLDPTIDEAYDMYVSLMRDSYLTRDYASKEVFVVYYNHILG